MKIMKTKKLFSWTSTRDIRVYHKNIIEINEHIVIIGIDIEISL